MLGIKITYPCSKSYMHSIHLFCDLHLVYGKKFKTLFLLHFPSTVHHISPRSLSSFSCTIPVYINNAFMCAAFTCCKALENQKVLEKVLVKYCRFQSKQSEPSLPHTSGISPSCCKLLKIPSKGWVKDNMANLYVRKFHQSFVKGMQYQVYLWRSAVGC